MSLLTLPGLIDPHVHLRDPGQTYKEDFYTGTCAALAGGFTTIFDMPNNKIPITTLAKLNEKIKIAKEKIVCDVGFYFGSMGDNLEEFEKVKGKVLGLKLYLNQTTGNFLIDKNLLEKAFIAWGNKSVPRARHSGKRSASRISNRSERFWTSQNDGVLRPILVHAEEKRVEDVINLVKKTNIPAHFCHISLAPELKMIIHAKEQGQPVTCGVTPHHLFLGEFDVKRLGAFGKMKPPLESKQNQDFLWKNLKYIDVIESDHAPHTMEEKGSDNSPFGVPGLETTLPLLLTAVSEKRLNIKDVIRLCHKNPAKIFGIKRFDDSNHRSRIEVDLSEKYTIENKNLFTKCVWSPFEGFKVKGKVLRVFLRGKKVFENGKIFAKAGSGKIIKPD